MKCPLCKGEGEIDREPCQNMAVVECQYNMSWGHDRKLWCEPCQKWYETKKALKG